MCPFSAFELNTVGGSWLLNAVAFPKKMHRFLLISIIFVLVVWQQYAVGTPQESESPNVMDQIDAESIAASLSFRDIYISAFQNVINTNNENILQADERSMHEINSASPRNYYAFTRNAVVNLPNYGVLQGSIGKTKWTQKIFYQFLGVKYAESPSGPRRFKVNEYLCL